MAPVVALATYLPPPLSSRSQAIPKTTKKGDRILAVARDWSGAFVLLQLSGSKKKFCTG